MKHAIHTAAASSDLAAAALSINTLAWLDLFDAVAEPQRSALGVQHQAILEGHCLSSAGVDHLMFNRLALAPPEAVAPAAELFAERGIRRYLLSFAADEIAAAAAAGEKLGLVRFHRPWQTMARHAAAPFQASAAPAGVAIEHANHEQSVAAAALLAAAFDLPAHAALLFESAFGRPGWTLLCARDGTRVVGAGLLFQEADHACLFAGATAPSQRRRGIQRALVSRRVELALQCGAKFVASETGVAIPGQPNPSELNLAHAGLRPVHVTEHLCPAGAGWGPA